MSSLILLLHARYLADAELSFTDASHRYKKLTSNMKASLKAMAERVAGKGREWWRKLRPTSPPSPEAEQGQIRRTSTVEVRVQTREEVRREMRGAAVEATAGAMVAAAREVVLRVM